MERIALLGTMAGLEPGAEHEFTVQLTLRPRTLQLARFVATLAPAGAVRLLGLRIGPAGHVLPNGGLLTPDELGRFELDFFDAAYDGEPPLWAPAAELRVTARNEGSQQIAIQLALVTDDVSGAERQRDLF